MPALIDDLQNPALLPDRTQRVSVVQTHISIVFVADDFVYKVKKPVNFGFLDFSTLEKRRYYCHQEVRLNRRLSRGLYIDVIPIIFDGNKHTMNPAAGDVVEYAVKMKRLPDERLMMSLFEKGELRTDHLEEIAEVLARFHLAALRNKKIDQFAQPEKFRINTDENFAQVEKYIGVTIRDKDFNALMRWTNDFYIEKRELFLKRIEHGKIRDCHGDLHMEHVFISEGVSIFDCIEFNDRFRYSDTVADIAFLLMDLEYHGGDNFSKILWSYYSDLSGERNVDSLLTFYKVYRAFVRGKVNSFQIDDQTIGPDEKQNAVERAKSYFQLAKSYIDG